MFNKKKIFGVIKIALALIALIILVMISYASLKTPSNGKSWNSDQKVLAYYEREENILHVYNIRNISYITTKDYTLNYYNKDFDLDKLESIYFMVEPFKGEWGGAAHTLLTYGFSDKRYLSVSVEIRKEQGESFSAAKGLLNNYELMYVLADDKDVLKLRSNYRHDEVYLYPINTTKEKMKAMLISMLERTNKLKDSPEFYNTISSTCTTNIVDHVNEISPKRIAPSYMILAPGFSDKYAYSLGLIKTSKSFNETREECKINSKSIEFADSDEYYEKIRCHPYFE